MCAVLTNFNFSVKGGGGRRQYLAAVDLRDECRTAYAAEEPGGMGTGLVAAYQFLAFQPGKIIRRHRLDICAECGSVEFSGNRYSGNGRCYRMFYSLRSSILPHRQLPWVFHGYL